MPMDRQKLLLILVAGLAFIKFVVFPFEEMRLEKVDEFEQKHNRNLKAQQLIDSGPVIREKLQSVEQQLMQFESFFPVASSSQEAQLKVQQQLQVIAENKKVLLEEIEWIETQSGRPELATLKISFDGKYKDVMLFVTEAENLGPWLITEELVYRVSNQRVKWKRLGQAKGSITLSVNYIVNENQSA